MYFQWMAHQSSQLCSLNNNIIIIIIESKKDYSVDFKKSGSRENSTSSIWEALEMILCSVVNANGLTDEIMVE